MSDVDEPRFSQGDVRARNAYLREFLPLMVLYGVSLAVVLPLVDDATGASRLLILIPLAPLLGGVVTVIRAIRRDDEYGRFLQYRAMACGFGAAVVTSLVFAMLAIVDITTVASGWIVFAAAMATWGITLGLSGVR